MEGEDPYLQDLLFAPAKLIKDAPGLPVIFSQVLLEVNHGLGLRRRLA